MVPQFGIAKLVNISPISLWFLLVIYRTSYWDYNPSYNWEGHHLAGSQVLRAAFCKWAINERPANLSSMTSGCQILHRFQSLTTLSPLCHELDLPRESSGFYRAQPLMGNQLYINGLDEHLQETSWGETGYNNGILASCAAIWGPINNTL